MAATEPWAIRISMEYTDDWIESRIRLHAGKYGLPAGRTCFFSEASSDVRSIVSSALSPTDVGIPVLLGYDSPVRWSVLGTRQLVGLADERIRCFKHVDIASIASRDYPPAEQVIAALSLEELGRLKRCWEYLRIADPQGQTEDFWVPAGSEAFAFWNILLTLSRMLA
jgi:hypothetical protein